MNNQNKEIDNFETHVLSEHESFTKVVRVSIEEDTNKMKGYFEYTKEDVELIRNRCSYIENSLNKQIKDNPELEKQYNSLKFAEKVINGKAALVANEGKDAEKRHKQAQSIAALSIKGAMQAEKQAQRAQLNTFLRNKRR